MGFKEEQDVLPKKPALVGWRAVKARNVRPAMCCHFPIRAEQIPVSKVESTLSRDRGGGRHECSVCERVSE
jgi:hypothetical protein